MHTDECANGLFVYANSCYCCCFGMKVEDGEPVEDVNGAKDVEENDSAMDRGPAASNENDKIKNLLKPQQRGGFRTNGDQRASRMAV